DLVQVSCNLRAPLDVGPERVHRAVASLASEQGVEVVEGELVGLAPRAALPEDPAAMGLDNDPGSLEDHLAQAGLPTGVQHEQAP
ncbi:MAG: hypothetical protein R3185_07390, partial [Candidatus Thermoplasmatota archaeon]|nr:hypothetical protein [Candidatus Thermoplasmatota archaeon]